jgi:hypothetical protein
MITTRKIYDNVQKDYFQDLYEKHGGIPDNHLKAIQLRMDFFKKFILDRSPTNYKTVTEKDWTYIARREYYWDVTLRSIGDGLFSGLAASLLRMSMVKRFVIWPLLPVGLVVGITRHKDLFIFHNKKFFDMCNLGEEYEIGNERNKVLRLCNELLDREDF